MSNITTTKHKCTCGICSRPVNRNDKAIHCDSCFHWIHYKCNGLSLNDFCLLKSSNEVWYCKHCIASIFPFSSVDDSELYNLMNCRMPSHLDFLPSLDVLSKIWLTIVCETKWDETKWESVVCKMEICSLRNGNL